METTMTGRAVLRTGTGSTLARVRRVAELWDEAFRLPVVGWRIGWDAVVGLVPGVGDLLGAVVAGYIVLASARLGAPPVVVGRMLANVAIDATLGAVPLIGDLFDAGWKANRRNRILLERWLAEPLAVARRSGIALAAAVVGPIALIGLLGWLVVVAIRAVI